MTVQCSDCFIIISIIQHRAIITGQDDHGIFVNAQLFQFVQNLTNRPINLQDGITAQAQSAFSSEHGGRHARDMGFGQ